MLQIIVPSICNSDDLEQWHPFPYHQIKGKDRADIPGLAQLSSGGGPRETAF